jgi:hypothetical protein
MLQRIQTVYLLIIAALFAATLFMPLAVLQSGNELFRFDATGLSSTDGEALLIYPTWGIFGLVAIISIVSLATVFLFRNRILQIRFCIFNMLLMTGFYGLFIFFIYNLKGDMENASLSVRLALSFPFVGMILNYLAIRNIGADEALVRSLNRLR